MLDEIRTAMTEAMNTGSQAGEHGVDLQARMWLAAYGVAQKYRTDAAPPAVQDAPTPTAQEKPMQKPAQEPAQEAAAQKGDDGDDGDQRPPPIPSRSRR